MALVAQSGATAFGPLLAIARERGIGIHSIVSTGNEADLDFADYASYLLQQPEVGAVAGLIEGIRDGRKLFDVAAIAREVDKPIVVMKLGRSEVGQSAAKLHTAALAGDHAVSVAALRQAGVSSSMTMICSSKPRRRLPRGGGRRKARRGSVSLRRDRWTAWRPLRRPRAGDSPSADTSAKLAEILAGRGAAANPADVTMHYQLDSFGDIVRLLLGDPSFDALAVASTGENAARVVGAAAKESDKPVLFTWVGPIDGEGRENPSVERSPLVLAARAVRGRDEVAGGFRRVEAPARARRSGEPTRWRRGVQIRWLPGYVGAHRRARVESIGINLPAEQICAAEEEAIAAAERIGYPVAVKGLSPEITHKSDVGAVFLGVRDADEVRVAFRSATERLARAGGTVAGVLVQQMVDTKRGLELALGAIVDPAWGRS